MSGAVSAPGSFVYAYRVTAGQDYPAGSPPYYYVIEEGSEPTSPFTFDLTEGIEGQVVNIYVQEVTSPGGTIVQTIDHDVVIHPVNPISCMRVAGRHIIGTYSADHEEVVVDGETVDIMSPAKFRYFNETALSDDDNPVVVDSLANAQMRNQVLLPLDSRVGGVGFGLLWHTAEAVENESYIGVPGSNYRLGHFTSNGANMIWDGTEYTKAHGCSFVGTGAASIANKRSTSPLEIYSKVTPDYTNWDDSSAVLVGTYSGTMIQFNIIYLRDENRFVVSNWHDALWFSDDAGLTWNEVSV